MGPVTANMQKNISGGLLRGVAESRSQSPTQAAGYSPAIANTIQEPLSKTPPPGTSQIIQNKPNLDLNGLEDLLRNTIPPEPDVAARLIAALVSQPPAQEAGGSPAPAGGGYRPTSQPQGQAPISPGFIRGNASLGRQAVVGGPISYTPPPGIGGGSLNIARPGQAYAGQGTPSVLQGNPASQIIRNLLKALGL